MSSMYGGMGMRGPTGGMSGSKIPTGYRQASIANYSPEQMQLFQDMFSHVGPESFLSKLAGGDEDIFNQIEAPALQQFSGLQGNIASRFSGMGAGGRRSSGFQNTANQAASDFASQLQSQRQGLQQNAIRDLMGMSESLLGQRTHTNSLVQKKKSFLEELLGSILPSLLKGAGGAAFGAL